MSLAAEELSGVKLLSDPNDAASIELSLNPDELKGVEINVPILARMSEDTSDAVVLNWKLRLAHRTEVYPYKICFRKGEPDTSDFFKATLIITGAAATEISAAPVERTAVLARIGAEVKPIEADFKMIQGRVSVRLRMDRAIAHCARANDQKDSVCSLEFTQDARVLCSVPFAIWSDL